MMFFIFDSETEAIEAEAIIRNNALMWISANVPEALNGDSVKSRNASTGEWDKATTKKWADARMRNDGKWVIPIPEKLKVDPIPIEKMVLGIDAPAEKYNQKWFNQNE